MFCRLCYVAMFCVFVLWLCFVTLFCGYDYVCGLLCVVVMLCDFTYFPNKKTRNKNVRQAATVYFICLPPPPSIDFQTPPTMIALLLICDSL